MKFTFRMAAAALLIGLTALLLPRYAYAAPTLVIVDSAGDTGWDLSMTLNSEGNPVISYWDSSNGDLRLAVCDDPTCTSPTLTTVDSDGNTGWFTS
ncbi:MAG: hypothetical protein GYB64_19635, partial [Chloroflexi bacterium]|nr:hypothetical protein [Chloroflexota bacterium]